MLSLSDVSAQEQKSCVRHLLALSGFFLQRYATVNFSVDTIYSNDCFQQVPILSYIKKTTLIRSRGETYDQMTKKLNREIFITSNCPGMMLVPLVQCKCFLFIKETLSITSG